VGERIDAREKERKEGEAQPKREKNAHLELDQHVYTPATPAVIQTAQMKILEPLASFLGVTRMPRRLALATVLAHAQGGTKGEATLLDPDDSEYVLVDERLKPLLGDLAVTRVKLVKLAKLVARYIVTDDSHADAQRATSLAAPTGTHTHTHTRIAIYISYI